MLLSDSNEFRGGECGTRLAEFGKVDVCHLCQSPSCQKATLRLVGSHVSQEYMDKGQKCMIKRVKIKQKKLPLSQLT